MLRIKGEDQPNVQKAQKFVREIFLKKESRRTFINMYITYFNGWIYLLLSLFLHFLFRFFIFLKVSLFFLVLEFSSFFFSIVVNPGFGFIRTCSKYMYISSLCMTYIIHVCVKIYQMKICCIKTQFLNGTWKIPELQTVESLLIELFMMQWF